MTPAGMAAWMRERRWWLALLFVVILGYTIGKDRALRDNQADAIVARSAAPEG